MEKELAKEFESYHNNPCLNQIYDKLQYTNPIGTQIPSTESISSPRERIAAMFLHRDRQSLI